MNYHPRHNNVFGTGLLQDIQSIEMTEDWLKDRKKRIEDEIKKKSDEKKPHWLNDLTFPQVVLYTFTFGPWIGTLQYFMITEVLKRLTGH